MITRAEHTFARLKNRPSRGEKALSTGSWIESGSRDWIGASAKNLLGFLADIKGSLGPSSKALECELIDKSSRRY